MRKMNDIAVIINDKKYTLSGYESESYLKAVAAYMNGKLDEFQEKDTYRHLDTETKGVLLGLNIADDYFKAKNQIEELTEENKRKDNELFALKHEMMAVQTRLGEAQKELGDLKLEEVENQKKIVKLETELENRNYKGSKNNNKK